MKKEKLIALIMTCLGLAIGMVIGGLIFHIEKPLLEIIIAAVLGAVLTFIFRWLIDLISKNKS